MGEVFINVADFDIIYMCDHVFHLMNTGYMLLISVRSGFPTQNRSFSFFV